MKGWVKCELGDVLTLQRGYDLPSQNRLEGQVPIVSSNGISGFHNESKVKGPGVVTGRYGTIGQVFYIQEDFWPLNTALYLKDFKGNDERYLSYLLKTVDIKGLNAAGAVPGVNRNHLHKIKVKIAPLPVQRRIASILSAYDDLIENNLRRIKLLEELAQRTYEEWFVRFRFPGHETTVFNEETGLPEGWERRKLGEVLELVYGKALKADERDGGEFPVFGSSGIVGGHSKAIAKGPGVILGRKGNVGSVFWSGLDFFPIDTVYYINSDLSKYFIFYLLKSITFINNDAAVPGLNRNAAYMMESTIPSKKVISKFNDFVTSLFSQIEKLNNQNRLLKESRDILLPRLMSGEIELDELDDVEEELMMAAEPRANYVVKN